MSDATIQALRREGRPLSLRDRVPLVPLYTVVREVACDWCGGLGNVPHSNRTCPDCKGKGLVPYDQADLLRLMAFCGSEEARGIADDEEASKWVVYDTADLDLWADMLSRLAAELPPKMVEPWPCADCDGERGYALPQGAAWQCRKCGSVTAVPIRERTDTPASQWLLPVAAEAVARACLWHCETHWSPVVGAKEALDAARAWIKEPTPEREQAWWDAIPSQDHTWLPLPPSEPQQRVNELAAAGRIIGEARVREIASAAVLEVL